MLVTPDNIVSFDTETTGLWPWPLESRRLQGLGPDRPFAFSVANLEGEVAYFRATVDPHTRRVDYTSVRPELAWLKSLVADPKMTVVMHNAAFDLVMTRRIGFQWRCHIDDTRIMAHVADPSEPHGLKELSRKYLDIPVEDQTELKRSLQMARRQAKAKGWCIATKESHGKSPAMADYWLCPPDLLERYARLDAVRTIGLFRLYLEVLNDNLSEGGRLLEIYKHELRVFRAAVRMEEHGITVKLGRTRQLRKFYVSHAEKHMAEVHKRVSKDFNPGSQKQLKAYFVDQLDYVTENRTDKGNPKIDGTQIAKWADEHEDAVCRSILEWKASKKAVDELDRYEFFAVRDGTGRYSLHPRWKATGPITGRFACGDPNLMQITNEFSGRKRATLETRQRECFGPARGRMWYQIDYSQIEVWLFAFVSNDDTMKEALLSGRDFHGAVAEKVFSTRRSDYETDKARYRRRAKLIMFSKLYGGGVNRIAQLINCSVRESREFVSDFDTELPNVERFMKRLTNRTVREGKIVNLFGREYPVESGREYKCVNYVIQGTAAEIMKRAVVRVDDILRVEWPEAWIAATIHDELVIDLPVGYHSKRLLRQVIRAMQADHEEVGIPVPLPVKTKVVTHHMLNGREVQVA